MFLYTYTSLSDGERRRILQKDRIAENLHPVKQTSRLLNHIEKVLADDLQIDTTYAATLDAIGFVVAGEVDGPVNQNEARE